jgi:hypothetical protein
MKLTKLAYATFTAVALVAAAPAPAFAIFDTYISATGSDANPCTITNPCATFGGALSATQISGVIHCLDSRDYTDGIVTITKSVTSTVQTRPPQAALSSSTAQASRCNLSV